MSFQEIIDAMNEFDSTAEGYAYNLRLDLSNIIVKELNRRGWTQSDLAKKSNVTKAQINGLIHSTVNCTFKTVGMILHALGRPANLMVKENAMKVVSSEHFSRSARPTSLAVPFPYSESNHGKKKNPPRAA